METVEVIRNAVVTHACPAGPPRLSPIRYIAAVTTVMSSDATKVASSRPDRIAVTWRRTYSLDGATVTPRGCPKILPSLIRPARDSWCPTADTPIGDNHELLVELDLGAVRTFLAVVDDGHFTDAADRLGMTQQAVSKRIARLESDLGAPLLNRSRAGARLTEDGAAFLPHARALISLADQAAGMVRARRRALRIDALARDAAPSDLVRSFYETTDVAVDLVVSRGAIAQQTALTDGSVDAAFGRVTTGFAPGIERVPAFLEPLFVLVSRRHRLARRKRVPAQELSGPDRVDAGQRHRQRVG